MREPPNVPICPIAASAVLVNLRGIVVIVFVLRRVIIVVIIGNKGNEEEAATTDGTVFITTL